MAKIPWGDSVLKQANDAAVDFNKNLHEHFKVARKQNMMPTVPTGDPNVNDPDTSYSEHQGDEHVRGLTNKAGHSMNLTHNRKTGDVTTYVMSNNGSATHGDIKNDPKKTTEAIRETRKLNYKGD